MIAIIAALGAAVYATGVIVHDGRRPRRPFSRLRATCFGAGTVGLIAAFSPFMDELADRSFAAHMVQHLLMTLVAAPLLLLGAADRLALSCAPRPVARRIASLFRSVLVRALTTPAVAWTGFAVVMWSTHLSGFYQAALENEAVHVLEHGAYLASALLFWYPVVGSVGASGALGNAGRLLYVMLAMPPSAFLGLVIFESRHVLYPHYLLGGAANHAGAIADQRAGGAIMWIAGGLVLFIALLLIAADWARAETRLGARIDARIAREHH